MAAVTAGLAHRRRGRRLRAVVVLPLLSEAGLATTVAVGHGLNIVFATAAAAPLRDPAAAVLNAMPRTHGRRRLTPVGYAVLVLATTWPALLAVQAARVPGVPWGGLAVEAVAMVALACAAAVRSTGRGDPGLTATGVLAVIVLIDQGTAFGPWLTGGPGPGWESSRAAWALLGAGGVLLAWRGLRDPAKR